jgi:molybdate transport system substrate-binding protein
VIRRRAEDTVKIQTMRVFFMLTAIVASAIAVGWPAAPSVAQSQQLRVYTSDGFKPALQALIPKIEKSTGRKVSPEFDSSNVLQKRIDSGESFDVAILSTNVVNHLIESGKISAESRTDLGRAGIGVGMRAGAKKPDISSSDAMSKTLLNAKSIVFNRDGASAVHINQMVEKLGIADRVKPKFMLDVGAGQPQKDVLSGKAEMVITLIPEIEDFKGLELAGPLPGDLQSYIDFSGGVAVKSQDAAGAKAVIKVLTDPSVAATLKSKGIERK